MHRDVLTAHCERFLRTNRLETTQIVKIVTLKASFSFHLKKKKIENPDALGTSVSVEKIWKLGRLVLITVLNPCRHHGNLKTGLDQVQLNCNCNLFTHGALRSSYQGG